MDVPQKGSTGYPQTKKEKQNEECLSQLVDILQQVNKREEKLKGSVEF